MVFIVKGNIKSHRHFALIELIKYCGTVLRVAMRASNSSIAKTSHFLMGHYESSTLDINWMRDHTGSDKRKRIVTVQRWIVRAILYFVIDMERIS